jgi:hypothetical protein
MLSFVNSSSVEIPALHSDITPVALLVAIICVSLRVIGDVSTLTGLLPLAFLALYSCRSLCSNFAIKQAA